MLTRRKFAPNSMLQLMLGYAVIIAAGTILLALPISSKSSASTGIVDALFTATSATCVTGLVVFDTYSHWTLFGQFVILLLIQIGGIGFLTVIIGAMTLTHRRIGLRQRFAMQDAVSAPQVGGIVRMARFILFGSFLFEGLGALALAFRFCPQFGLLRGLYFAVFHSVSAFCNAGFDLMGYQLPASSMTAYANDPAVTLVMAALIVIGGLGFFVWVDIWEHGFRFRRFRLHTKMVLITTAFLIIFGTVLLMFFETTGDAFAGKNLGERTLLSLFQSITARTAGFNTIDIASLGDSSILLLICLMLIGGSPGSTAGGFKTTTLFLFFLCVSAEFRQARCMECFGRRLEESILRRAAGVVSLFAVLCTASAAALSHFDAIPLKEALFESASAIGTVGLSLGITGQLGTPSRLVLVTLMFIGRVGGLTILFAVSGLGNGCHSQLPLEKITVG
jgi:trk system potassium uptake protein TrkH